MQPDALFESDQENRFDRSNDLSKYGRRAELSSKYLRGNALLDVNYDFQAASDHLALMWNLCLPGAPHKPYDRRQIAVVASGVMPEMIVISSRLRRLISTPKALRQPSVCSLEHRPP